MQRRAARFVVGNFRRRSSVTEMLKRLGWSSLEERRKNARLIMLHKIISGGTPIAAEPPLLASASRRTRAANEHKFKQLTANTTVYQQSFFPRTIRDWNSVPQDYINRVTGGKLHCSRFGIDSPHAHPPPRCVILYTKRTASYFYRYRWSDHSATTTI